MHSKNFKNHEKPNFNLFIACNKYCKLETRKIKTDIKPEVEFSDKVRIKYVALVNN